LEGGRGPKGVSEVSIVKELTVKQGRELEIGCGEGYGFFFNEN